MTPHLQLDLALLGWSLTQLGGGYVRIEGCPFRGVVVLLDEVAQTERDDLIGCIAHRRIRTTEGAEWLLHRGGVPEALAMAKIAGFRKALVKRLTTKERLAGIPAKERLAGITTKERLAGIPTKERVAGLPAKERVAGLPAKERVAGLPAKELQKLVQSRKFIKVIPIVARSDPA